MQRRSRMKAGGMQVAVGLTGGIACGKTEVARIWSADGIAVLDTDEVAHEVMAPGGAAYPAVVSEFGAGILGADGRIDRAALGTLVFADADRRQRLNELVHPAVRAAWQRWRDQRRQAGEPAVVVIPLLFEVGADTGWDAVVCVSARRDVMMERLTQRGLNREDAGRRIAAQLPVEQKAERSDYVIVNNGTRGELAEAARATWRRIVARRGQATGYEREEMNPGD